MSKVNIEIPCKSCGCSTYEAKTENGEDCLLEICKCDDGSGEYEVTIFTNVGEPLYEMHRCDKNDITDCINSRFNINPETISHDCG